MALTDKLTAIADGFRSSRGTSNTYTLDQMAIMAAEKVTTDPIIIPSEIPSYIKTEVEEVIARVNSVRHSINNSIVFLCVSDWHHAGDETAASQSQINTSNLHAAMAIKALSYSLNLDFVASLGDMSWGSGSTTLAQQKGQIEQIESYLTDSWDSNLPQFWTPGNHDGGAYANLGLTSEYLFSKIGRHNTNTVYGSTTEGYCYRDFTDKKLRVICLNTAEGGAKEIVSNEQLIWFAKTLRDTLSGYNIIILSHHPLDWGSVCQASNVVYQFTKKGSVSYDGTTISFSSSGATILCTIHGHTHCFKTAKLNYISNSTGTEYDVYRIATPNACYLRNNEYGANGDTEYYGIEFGDTVTYAKTANCEQDTAFVVNVLDVDNKILHSICYGAGEDRSVYIGTETKYTVTNTLTNVTSNNTETLITKGKSYKATITPTTGYEIATFKVTMGGTDITSSAVNGNTITISSVTGNIVVTVIAKYDYGVTNLVPTSQALDSTAIFNTVGYQNNSYCSDSTTTSRAGYVCTGYIPYTWSSSNVIYIRGGTFDTTGYSRIYGYNSKGTVNGNSYATGERIWSNPTGNIYFTIEELESGNYYKLTPQKNLSNITYIRITVLGSGEDLIVTVNEPIVAGSSSETVAVTGITLSESAIALKVGDTKKLTATITPSNATNKNVTWSSSIPTVATVSNGVITALERGDTTIEVSTADGNYVAECQVLVTAAQTDSGNYTNRLSSLVNLTDGSTIFNSTGYIDDMYVSTVSPFYSADSSCVTTGAIVNNSLSVGNADARAAFNSYVYVKGLQFASSHSRIFAIYESGGTFAPSNRATFNITTDPTVGVETAVGTQGFKITKLGDKYYKFYIPTTIANGITSVAGVAFSGIAETGKNIIITFNEPIE